MSPPLGGAQVYKQANTEHISYPEAVRRVIAEDGFTGLMGRGLTTKIFANGMQVRRGETYKGPGVEWSCGAERGREGSRGLAMNVRPL